VLIQEGFEIAPEFAEIVVSKRENFVTDSLGFHHLYTKFFDSLVAPL